MRAVSSLRRRLYPTAVYFFFRFIMVTPSQDELHHITRIDIEPDDEHPDRSSTHGWLVRARRQGNRISKFFSDKKYGGREAALYDHAMVYRDALLADLPEPDDAARKSAEARSRSGVVGLNLTFKDIGNGTRKPYVQVSWMDIDGKRRAASYSAEKWGLRRSVWNACARLYKELEKKGEADQEPFEMFRIAYPNLSKQFVEKLAEVEDAS